MALGKGDALKQTKTDALFFLSPPYWLITWLLKNCKQNFKVFQPLSLKTSMEKIGQFGRIAMELFLYFLEEVQAAPGKFTLSLLVTPCTHNPLEVLFTLGKKGESPATVNLETRTHAFIVTRVFILGFGFTDGIKIRMESSVLLNPLVLFTVKVERSLQGKILFRKDLTFCFLTHTCIYLPIVFKSLGLLFNRSDYSYLKQTWNIKKSTGVLICSCCNQPLVFQMFWFTSFN